MGRPAKPTRMKELAGNPGKRPLNKSEPKTSSLPMAPSGMTARAKTAWAKIVHAMPPGVYTALDSNLLAAYCEAVSLHGQATAKLTKGPLEITGSTGQVKVTPWIGVQSEAARLIATLGAKLGLDPVSRQQINSEEGQAADEFDGLIN